MVGAQAHKMNQAIARRVSMRDTATSLPHRFSPQLYPTLCPWCVQPQNKPLRTRVISGAYLLMWYSQRESAYPLSDQVFVNQTGKLGLLIPSAP